MQSNIKDAITNARKEEIKVDDYVIYLPLHGRAIKVKRRIWKVHSIRNDIVNVQSIIGNSSFNANSGVLILVPRYIEIGLLTDEHIANGHIQKYEEELRSELKNSCSEVIRPPNHYYINNNVSTINQTGDVSLMNKIIESNVSAAKQASVISAGNTLNKVVKNAIRGRIPRKYRKAIDSPLGDIVVANAASFAVLNFAKTNTKASVATQAMMTAAMVSFMNSFNLDVVINDLLKNVNIDELMDINE